MVEDFAGWFDMSWTWKCSGFSFVFCPGSLYSSFLKNEASLNCRMVTLCVHFMESKDCEMIFEKATDLCFQVQTIYNGMSATFAGKREPWVDAVGKCVERFSALMDKAALQELCDQIDKHGHEAAVKFLGGLSHLPGRLADCKQILIDRHLLLKLDATKVPEELSELSKDMNNVATLSSYSMDLVKAMLPNNVEGIMAYFQVVYDSMNVGIAAVESEAANWRELLSKYRLGMAYRGGTGHDRDVM